MARKTTMEKEREAALLRNLPKRMDIRVDWAFKHLFSKKKHLIKIIKDLLDMDIEVIEYLPNALDVDSEQDKKSVFDVICKDCQTGEIFVLEMQTTYESDMNDRLYYYAGSLIHNQVHSGDEVYSVNAVLVCCIASYRVPHKQTVPDGKVFFHYKMLEKGTYEVFDGDKLNICFLELERFDNYLDKNTDLKKQWCWIFNNLATFVHRPECLDHSFDEIIDDSVTLKLSNKEKLAYMEARTLSERERRVIREGGYIIGKEDGFAEGMEKGMERGMERGRQLVVKAMLAKGVPADTIAEALGLPTEDVLKMQ